jgi:hypothetical protein
MRSMPHTVYAPTTPMYALGDLNRNSRRLQVVRKSHTVRAPQTPIYQLGYFGAAAQIVGASAPIAAASAGAIASAYGAAGSVAGPIGAAVGAVVGVIAGLLAGHELRAKQAKNENSAVNLGVQGFDSDVRAIQSAFKSGQIDASGVMQALATVMPGYWQVVGPQLQPGRNGCNSGSSCPAQVTGKQPCVGSIGAGCCVACYQLQPGVTGPNGIAAAVQGQSQSAKGPYIAEIPQVFGSSYGASSRSAYTLDFTPPATVSPTASISSALDSITGTAGGGSSLLPLLLIGGAVYLATR